MSYSKLYIDTDSSLIEVSRFIQDQLAKSFNSYNEHQLKARGTGIK